MIDLKTLWEYLQHLGIHVSDKVSYAVGTWRFVFLYTGTMILWIYLHRCGLLHYDSPDFIKFNLWLSYFAGTQASIVLMSTTRQASLDRHKHDLAFNIDKESLDLAREHQDTILSLMHQLQELEDIIEELLIEKERREVTDESRKV